MAILFTLLSALVLPAPAFPESTNEFSYYLNELSRLEEALQAQPECSAYAEAAKLGCSEITDNVCRTLWNGSHNGNLEVFDGRIAQGKSKISKLRLYELANYQALADSLPRLPADIQKAAAPILTELASALKREEDSRKWRREISDLKTNFTRAVNDVVEERQKALHPKIMAKPSSERTLDEGFILDSLAGQAEDEILNAQYADHPNWKRVEKVFAEAKSDILANIEAMNIPKATKEKLSAKLGAATLTLPYTNDGGRDANDDCASTTVNASYSPSRNELTVCAGLFNAFQSESALYFTVAHELGHAIDTGAQAEIDYESGSTIHQTFQRLVNPNDMSCQEWAVAKRDLFKTPDTFASKAAGHPLEKLASCLKDRSKLKPLETAAVRSAVDRSVSEDLSWYAERNQFLKLSQPTITAEGKAKPNPYYLRPDLIPAYLYPPYGDGKRKRSTTPREIFYQELRCQPGTKDGNPATFAEIADKSERTRIFKAALDETYRLEKVRLEDKLTYCGQACPELLGDRMATNSDENSADWFAMQATLHFLKRAKSPTQKREAAALSTALFCTEPGAAADAPELALIEKYFSQESHPDDRLRRISLFSPEIASSLGCETDPNAQGFSQCSP